MDSIPPIQRGEFVYRDTLFVDVGGERKRHPRAAEADLKSLLTGKAPKDQVAHWYEAQLIHYGLQRSKDKNTAKVRLQQALNQGKLKIPPHFIDMESQMKKDYAAAVRKGKKTAGSEAIPAPSKKRKNDEESSSTAKKTKITMNVGGLFINIEHDAQSSAKKKASASENPTAKAATTKKAAATKSDGQPAKQQKITAQAVNQPKASPAKAKGGKDVVTPSKTAATAKPSADKERKPPKSVPKVKVDPIVKAEAKVKAEPKIKKEPTLSRASPVKREAKVKSESNADFDGIVDQQQGPRNVTGVYTLSCPQLADQLPDQANNFRLFLCVDGDQIWGGFELGMKTGVLRIDEIRLDQTITFGWRAKDSWENNRMAFGRGCFGEIELYGRYQVRGTFHNLSNEPMVFEGQRRPGPLWCGRSAYSFQQEWDGFVTQAYGR